MRDAGSSEIGAFGITPADDLLFVTDIRLVRQVCTATSVVFDDTAVAELFDDLVDEGLRPEQFARIWIHTHPGLSASPSCIDLTTFRTVFGRCDWALMFILAKGGATYARLQFTAGPGGSLRLPVRIDWSQPFAGTDEREWQAEYDECVRLLEDLRWTCAVDDPLAFAADPWPADVPWEPWEPELPRSTLYEDA